MLFVLHAPDSKEFRHLSLWDRRTTWFAAVYMSFTIFSGSPCPSYCPTRSSQMGTWDLVTSQARLVDENDHCRH